MRRRILILAGVSLTLLILTAVLGFLWMEEAEAINFAEKNLAPCPEHIFGTDWMGRDMFKRTVAGLSMSIRLGVLTAAVSSVIALVMAAAASLFGTAVDRLVSGLTDLVMGIPHILLLILISCAAGKGFWGVTVGISVTHWPSLARLLRAEMMRIRESPYVKISEKLGMSPLKIAREHMIIQVFPQFVTGLVLMFPHAILHEASITFLGFGLSPEKPAVGVILSESMSYLITGKWWLAFFPGAALVVCVLLFQGLGQGINRLLDPAGAHE